jgi:hypothetical protein
MGARPAEEILGLLRRGEPVREAEASGPLDLRVLCGGDDLRVPVRLAGCRLWRLDADCVQFHQPVILEGCVVESEASFFAAYFLAGLRVESCTFQSGLDLQCGGHNRGGHKITLAGTAFEGFVNFFDCWFEGPVVVRGCRFGGGTNLLGNQGRPYGVRFDVPPDVEGNWGDLSLDVGVTGRRPSC